MLDECCSEDETDNEATDSTKVCKVRRFEWRSAALEEVLIMIDEYRVTRNASSPLGTPGVSPRQRVRNQGNPFSLKDAPAGLPIDCYNPAWLYGPDPQTERVEVLHSRPLAAIRSVLMRL